MKRIVVITGANGLIGKALSEKLKGKYELRCLVRQKRFENDFEWNVERKTIDARALEGATHIIHLAGANIAEKYWTKSRKQELLSSRVDSTKLLLDTLKAHQIKLHSFVSASAIGFYGSQTTETIYAEDSPKGNDFLSEVVYRWEQAVDLLYTMQVAQRVVKLRSGVVLSDQGGALPKMAKPIKYYLGSALGSGKQYMPWIHIEDLCAIYAFVLENERLSGVYNAVAPQHVSNKTLTTSLAKAMDRRLILPNVPQVVVRSIFGEASTILLEGSRVSSQKISSEGFHFKYPDLEPALDSLNLKAMF